MLTKSIVKKVSSIRSIGKWVFWNPCFTTDCREVLYIIIYNFAELHNFRLGRFQTQGHFSFWFLIYSKMGYRALDVPCLLV